MGVLGENLLALSRLPETLDSDEKINTDSVDATADVPKALKPLPPPLVLENGLTHSGTSTGTDRDCSGGEEEFLMLGISNCDQTPETKRLCLNNQGAAEEINRFCLIPEHVVEQILLSLDADSLRDCKHVCRTWFHLISDPSFINKHLDLVCNRKNAKMISIIGYNIFSTVTVCEGDDGNTVDNDDYFCCVIEHVKIPLKVKKGENLPRFIEVSHCNGIIHVFDRSKNTSSILYNPTLRKFKLLRGPAFPLTKLLGCGFGYDTKSNVYKYVKIFYNKDCGDTVAMVHTLGTNSSSWRVIKFDVLEDILNHNVKGMYCKGACYWLYQTRNEGVILSFDMSAEIFRRIPIPYHEVQQNCNCNRERLRLGEWNQSVVLFVATELNWDSSLYELWVLVDSVDKGFANTHWIKCLIIGPLQPQYSPFEFWKDDELFLLADMNEVVSYNVYSQQIRKVHFRGRVICHKFSTQCLKTLVSV